MKKILLFLIGILTLSLASCDTYFYSGYNNRNYDDSYYGYNKIANVDNIDIRLVITYGTPYYYHGYLNYYYYNGLYYYPFYYNNLWYFRPYYQSFGRGYFPDCSTWLPNPNWIGYQGFGRPDRYGRVYRYYYRENNNYPNYSNGNNYYQNNTVNNNSNTTYSEYRDRFGGQRSFGNQIKRPIMTPSTPMRSYEPNSSSNGFGNQNNSINRPSNSGSVFGGHR